MWGRIEPLLPIRTREGAKQVPARCPIPAAHGYAAGLVAAGARLRLRDDLLASAAGLEPERVSGYGRHMFICQSRNRSSISERSPVVN